MCRPKRVVIFYRQLKSDECRFSNQNQPRIQDKDITGRGRQRVDVQFGSMFLYNQPFQPTALEITASRPTYYKRPDPDQKSPAHQGRGRNSRRSLKLGIV